MGSLRARDRRSTAAAIDAASSTRTTMPTEGIQARIAATPVGSPIERSHWKEGRKGDLWVLTQAAPTRPVGTYAPTLWAAAPSQLPSLPSFQWISLTSL